MPPPGWGPRPGGPPPCGCCDFLFAGICRCICSGFYLLFCCCIFEQCCGPMFGGGHGPPGPRPF